MCSPIQVLFFFFFFNDTATTEIYSLSPTRRSSDLQLEARCARTGDAAVRRERRARQSRSRDRKSTRLNSSHDPISYAVFCLKKTKITSNGRTPYPVAVWILSSGGSSVCA